VRRQLGGKLLEFGHIVEAVGSLQGAMAAASTPDLILSDYLIGDATARDIGRLWPAVPMVVISGHPQPIDFPGQWVMKPWNEEDIRRAIERAMTAP